MSTTHPVMFLLLAAAMAGNAAWANVKGRAIAEAAVEGDSWVGQQLTINLDLKTTGYNFSDTQFNLPRVEGGFLMQVDSTTIKLTETHNGETWQVVRYPLAFFPQKAGLTQIPPIKVRFTSASAFGSTPRDFDLQTQTLSLGTRMPPGVNPGALVVSTNDFDMRYQWSPAGPEEETLAARPGDAITLEVIRRAGGISGMLFDPLPVFQAPGLRAYPEAPEVNDHVQRGDLTGERIDSVSWIIEQGGSYQLPEIRIQWWNPETEELLDKRIPGLAIEVPAPATSDPGTAEVPTRRSSWLALALVGGAIFLAMLARRRLKAPWQAFVEARRAQRAGSEPAAFQAVSQACRDGDALKAYGALYHWLDRVAPNAVSLSMAASSANSPELGEEIAGLQKAIVNGSDWKGERLLALLRSLRRIDAKQGQGSVYYLPALNPRN